MKKSIIVIAVSICIMSVTLSSAIATEEISPLTATASSTSYSCGPERTVDGNLNSSWYGGGNASPWWILFDVGDAKQIGKIEIQWCAQSYTATDYDIQISSDGTNWVNVFTRIQGVYSSVPEEREINKRAQYIRLYIYAVGKRFPGISEFVAYKSVGPVNQPPTAQASADSASGGAPLTVQFMGGGTDPDGSIVSYDWTFGDGGSSGQQNPAHTYDTAGNYTATLIVTDDDGATDSDTVTIDVGEEPSGGSVPHLMRFHGNLGDADGQPLAGIFTLSFRIYDSETGGTPLWTEQQENIDIEKGFLDVVLGSVTSLDLSFDKQCWLSVEVESDGEMTPRFMLTTVPYSYTSEK